MRHKCRHGKCDRFLFAGPQTGASLPLVTPGRCFTSHRVGSCLSRTLCNYVRHCSSVMGYTLLVSVLLFRTHQGEDPPGTSSVKVSVFRLTPKVPTPPLSLTHKVPLSQNERLLLFQDLCLHDCRYVVVLT